jgi:hypothetical protein
MSKDFKPQDESERTRLATEKKLAEAVEALLTTMDGKLGEKATEFMVAPLDDTALFRLSY